VSENTNKILLLTSGRITECDKPLITDDDMFLTKLFHALIAGDFKAVGIPFDYYYICFYVEEINV
jgi:hypothetical protein